MRPLSFYEGQKLVISGRPYEVANVYRSHCVIVDEHGYSVCVSKRLLTHTSYMEVQESGQS